MATKTKAAFPGLRARLADDLDEGTERVTDRYAQLGQEASRVRAAEMGALSASIRAGESVVVEADALAWTLDHFGLAGDARRVSSRGGFWHVDPDGKYRPVTGERQKETR